MYPHIRSQQAYSLLVWWEVHSPPTVTHPSYPSIYKGYSINLWKINLDSLIFGLANWLQWLPCKMYLLQENPMSWIIIIIIYRLPPSLLFSFWWSSWLEYPNSKKSVDVPVNAVVFLIKNLLKKRLILWGTPHLIFWSRGLWHIWRNSKSANAKKSPKSFLSLLNQAVHKRKQQKKEAGGVFQKTHWLGPKKKKKLLSSGFVQETSSLDSLGERQTDGSTTLSDLNHSYSCAGAWKKWKKESNWTTFGLFLYSINAFKF